MTKQMGFKLIELYALILLLSSVWSFGGALLIGEAGSVLQVYVNLLVSLIFTVAFLWWNHQYKEGIDIIGEKVWGYMLLFITWFPKLLFWTSPWIISTNGDKSILHSMVPMQLALQAGAIAICAIILGCVKDNPALRTGGWICGISCLLLLLADGAVTGLIFQGASSSPFSLLKIIIGVFTLVLIRQSQKSRVTSGYRHDHLAKT